jgi:hypothetical protein
VDFTREPIIESVITPKEGCKLVIRSSKGAAQEEFFVDAVEVVSFGNTFFLRSMERPKAFLVPASDYEILEVRETRMVLKNVGLDRSIKIGGGKEPAKKPVKEAPPKVEQEKVAAEPKLEPKRREKRRHYRRRKGRDKLSEEGSEEGKIDLPEPRDVPEDSMQDLGSPITPTPSILGSLLPPPPNLISETIERYKDNALFKDVFYSEPRYSNEDEDEEDEIEEPTEGFVEDNLFDQDDSVIESEDEDTVEDDDQDSDSDSDDEHEDSESAHENSLS